MSHACYVCNYAPVPDGEAVECPHCHRLQYGSACPYCGTNAPTVIRNGAVTCSACARPRGPIAGGIPLNVAGRPSQLGGNLARGAGWAALVVGWLLAVVLWVLSRAIPTADTAWHIAHTIVLLAAVLAATGGSVVGGGALWGGRWLRARGNHAQRSAREQALFAVARLRGGLLSALEAATALNVPLADADALLTKLAEQGALGVEVDATGTVYYVFREVRALQNLPVQGGAALRPVEPGGRSGVRVEAASTSPSGSPDRMTSPQEQARAQVDAEYQQLKTLSGIDPRKRP